jgi:hypothetical protein
MHRFSLLFNSVAAALALLAGVGAAQDAKKAAQKVIPGSVPSAWKTLKLSADQIKKIQAIDAEYKTKIAALTKKTEELQQQSRLEMAKQLTDDQKTLLAALALAADLTLQQRMALEEYGAVRREASALQSDIRRTVAVLTVQRADLKAAEKEKVPADLIEEYVNKHALVKNEQSEIARLEDRIRAYRNVAKNPDARLTQMQQDLNQARAHLQKVKSDVQPEALQAIHKSLNRQRVHNIEEHEQKLKVLKEHNALVLQEAAKLLKEADRLGIAAFELELRRAEKEENDLKRSKDKDNEK